MMRTTFAWFDYFIFISLLVISALVGIYYGVINQQKTATDYLMGGKQMSIWPIAMSLVSSQLSGLILISLPADTYRYGISFWLTVPMMACVTLAAYYIYLPVFHKLGVTSIYEYLNYRFNNKVRIYASVLFTIYMILYLPIIVYVPALALGQVTGVSIHLITPVVCGVCIFYTTLGGMKAIVRTDSIQFSIMIGTFFVVVIIGIWSAGGFQPIISKSYERGRLDISFDFDLLKRDTFWGCTIGTFFMMLNHFPCSQNFVQKCLSLPSFGSIKWALILSTVGVMLVKTLCIFAGLVIFAKYSDCDPLETKLIKNIDQILPLYVMDTSSFIPGFPGLFMSGIFSAALSCLSASLNCLAATIFEDFISPFIPKDTSQERISLYLKLLVVSVGIFATLCVFIIEKLGSLLMLTISLTSVTGGSLLGLFSVGMLVPMVNSKGALYGGIISLVINAWLIMGGLWYKMQGKIVYPMLPVSTEGCNETIINTLNVTILKQFNPEDDPPFILYRLSIYWFVMFGVFIVFLSSVIISYFTKDDKIVNKNCFSPLVHFLLKEDQDKAPHYDTIEKAVRITNDY